MQAATELTTILHGLLTLHKSRANFIAEFILSLIKVRTVNWVEISQSFPGKSKLSSKYRRIQRFFHDCRFCKRLIAEIIASFFPPPQNGWVLSLDRTNWNFGLFKINILMLSITNHNLAVPLIWILLPKKGNSNTNERIKLMSIFLEIFSHKNIASLLGDREFIGDEWLKWLQDNSIRFTLRIKNNFKIINKKNKSVKVKKLFYKSSFRGKVLKNQVTLGKVKVCIAGLRIPSGEWLIIATNHDKYNALARYKLRWKIETMFASFKTRGFNLEQTHISCIAKIDTLLSLLALTYIWAYKLGEIEVKKSPIKIKSHGYKQCSVFRVGLDLLRTSLLNLDSCWREIRDYVKVFIKNLKKIFEFEAAYCDPKNQRVICVV